MSRKKSLAFYPGRMILFSVIGMIALGTFLLSLPIAQTKTLQFIDILFTSASATSITGLLTIPLESFTRFGLSVILCLMQIGGIGLVSLTIFSISLFVDLGLEAQLLAGEILEMDNWKKARKRLLFIIGLTFFTEVIGCGLFYLIFSQKLPKFQALFVSLFHSVSSFCNVGITLFDKNLIPFKSDLSLLFITGFLIFSGGFGFLTWHELFYAVKAKFNNKRVVLSLTTKVSLWANLFLLLIAGALFFGLESEIGFFDLSPSYTFANVLFNTISYRSTGFSTLNVNQMHYATIFVIMMFGFIGSSAGSTGSGVKQSTFAIFFATVRSAILGRTTVHLLGRRIPKDQVFKSIAIISLSLAWIFGSTFFLLLIETGHQFIDIFFEVVSSFVNLGLSTGITQHLSPTSKAILIFNMIVGRIGSLTLILALIRKKPKREFEYPEERIALH